MNKKQLQQFKKIVSECISMSDFEGDLNYALDYNQFTDVDNVEEVNKFITEMAEDNDIISVDIIYYSNAMKYLSENDVSLTESFELASDMGYTLGEELNSEILASIHATEQNRADFNLLVNDICERVDDVIFNSDDEVQNE